MEICWAILRYFGYDNNLDIKQELWDDNTITEQDLQESRSFELHTACSEYLAGLFK